MEVATQLNELWNFIESNPLNFDWEIILETPGWIRLSDFYQGNFLELPYAANIPLPGLVLNVFKLIGKIPSNYINWNSVAQDYDIEKNSISK